MVARNALLTLALTATCSCSLAGIADGGSGGSDATTAATTATGDATTSDTTGMPTAATAPSSEASSGTTSEGGGAGTTSSGGGAGGAATSDLFRWAERSGSSKDESTLEAENLLTMTTLADGTVIVASVINDDESTTEQHVVIVGLREVEDGWVHVFELDMPRSDDDAGNGSTGLGPATASGNRFAIPLSYKGVLDLPDETIQTGSQDGVVFVGEVDESGALDSTTILIDGTGAQLPESVLFLDGGDLLVGGRVSTHLGCPETPGDIGGNQAFAARYDTTSGDCLASIHFGDLGSTAGTGIRALALGDDGVFVAGAFAGDLFIGGDTYPSAGSTDVFLFGLDVSSGVAFDGGVVTFGGGGRDVVSAAVALSGAPAFVLAGETQDGSLDTICPAQQELTGAVHAFVARFDLAGACEWLDTWQTGGGSTSSGARAMVRGSQDGIFIAGPFISLAPCGGGETWDGPDSDGFVFRLDPATGALTHAAHFGADSEQTATALAFTSVDLGPMVGGSYNTTFDPLLPIPRGIDLYVGALQPMKPMTCPRPAAR